MTSDGIANTNQKHWERMVQEGCGFTVPWLDLDRETLRRFAAGEATPVQLVELYPSSIFADVEGRDVLCLASGGGQQSAVFSLLGARVTVVDFVQGQLDGDRKAAAHYGYEVTTIQADMCDLSCLADASFDIVFQAPSTAYIPDIAPMYSEVARVIRPGGLYRTCFSNPVAEFAEWDGRKWAITVPYAENPAAEAGWCIEFRHHLSDIFNGLTSRGFSIETVQEDPQHLLDGDPVPGSWMHYLRYFPAFAVVARKAARPAEESPPGWYNERRMRCEAS